MRVGAVVVPEPDPDESLLLLPHQAAMRTRASMSTPTTAPVGRRLTFFICKSFVREPRTLGNTNRISTDARADIRRDVERPAYRARHDEPLHERECQLDDD